MRLVAGGLHPVPFSPLLCFRWGIRPSRVPRFLVSAGDDSGPIARPFARPSSASPPPLLVRRAARCSFGCVRSPPPLASLRGRAVSSHFQPEENDGKMVVSGEKGASWTVVLLGWMGGEMEKLEECANFYINKGIRTVRFVVPVEDLLSLLTRKRTLEERVARLVRELASWCSEAEKEGRESHLLFHIFSNGGWLTYGLVLEDLQSSTDITGKIKGCIFDSAPATDMFNPQVWALAIYATLPKKSSSLINTFAQDKAVAKVDHKLDALKHKNTNASFFKDLILGLDELKHKNTSATFSEVLILSLLEMFLTEILMLPGSKQRLRMIISTLSNRQPVYPQLYLYSSADHLIPASSVENFIEEQRSLGRDVSAHDFGSSPHVAHFMRHPKTYSAKLDEFLDGAFQNQNSRTKL